MPANLVNAEVCLTPVHEVVVESDAPGQLLFRPAGVLQDLEGEHFRGSHYQLLVGVQTWLGGVEDEF
jgi:hypothetical protein